MIRLRLKKPLEQVLRAGHPWVYRDALDAPDGVPPAGEVVVVVDAKGRCVARGLAEDGPIAVRVFTTEDENVDAALIEMRLARAAELRARVVPERTDAFRLVHGEGDRLPGLVCDVYGATAVIKLDGDAAHAWRHRFVAALLPVLEARGIANVLLRSGRGEQRQIECVRGSVPDGRVEVQERGMTLLVDLAVGQKTGMFLDHRESRFRVRALARELRVLNLYGYTGGFSIAAGLGDAREATTVDSAAGAVELADLGWARNELEPERHHGVVDDVPRFLQHAAERGERWDLIVADPPSFAPNEASVPRALASYRTLHAACLRVLVPGGLYLAASCSSHVDAAAFEETLGDAARKQHRVLQVLERTGAPADHPRLLAFPEGDYLAVVLCRA